jgi:hypothetical protein
VGNICVVTEPEQEHDYLSRADYRSSTQFFLACCGRYVNDNQSGGALQLSWVEGLSPFEHPAGHYNPFLKVGERGWLA